MPKSPESSGTNPSFTDIDRLEDVNGLVAIISQRHATGALTFTIRKEFERDGIVAQSAFVGEHLIGAYIALATLVEQRIAEIRKNGIPMLDSTRVRVPSSQPKDSQRLKIRRD